jgi:hypothetical protein
VGLEGDDSQGGRPAGKVDHGLMATVDSVEIAHGNSGATRGRVKPMPLKML